MLTMIFIDEQISKQTVKKNYSHYGRYVVLGSEMLTYSVFEAADYEYGLDSSENSFLGPGNCENVPEFFKKSQIACFGPKSLLSRIVGSLISNSYSIFQKTVFLAKKLGKINRNILFDKY